VSRMQRRAIGKLKRWLSDNRRGEECH